MIWTQRESGYFVTMHGALPRGVGVAQMLSGALLVFKDEPHRLMVELKLRATSFLLLTYRMER